MYQSLLLKQSLQSCNLYLGGNVGEIACLLNYYIIIKLLLLGVQYFRQTYNWHWVFTNNSFYIRFLKKYWI